MMSSHSLIGLVQSFFTKSDVEAEDPMMAMSFGIASLPSVLHFVACWSLVRQTRQTGFAVLACSCFAVLVEFPWCWFPHGVILIAFLFCYFYSSTY